MFRLCQNTKCWADREELYWFQSNAGSFKYSVYTTSDMVSAFGLWLQGGKSHKQTIVSFLVDMSQISGNVLHWHDWAASFHTAYMGRIRNLEEESFGQRTRYSSPAWGRFSADLYSWARCFVLSSAWGYKLRSSESVYCTKYFNE